MGAVAMATAFQMPVECQWVTHPKKLRAWIGDIDAENL